MTGANPEAFIKRANKKFSTIKSSSDGFEVKYIDTPPPRICTWGANSIRTVVLWVVTHNVEISIALYTLNLVLTGLNIFLRQSMKPKKLKSSKNKKEKTQSTVEINITGNVFILPASYQDIQKYIELIRKKYSHTKIGD